jgi:hypothetical protein
MVAAVISATFAAYLSLWMTATGEVSQPSAASHRLDVIEAVGCLSSEAKDAWVLEKATAPRPASSFSTSAIDPMTLGDRKFRLLGISLFNPTKHAGHTVRVQGLLVKDAINVTSLTTLSKVCEA